MDELAELKSEVPEWFVDAMRVPREEGSVDVEGCSIRFLEWGNRANPGLVLMHGGRAHARCFAFIAPLLANQFHVVAYDFSGNGDSGRREEYPQELWVEEFRHVARATRMYEGNRKPFLAGHSRGGDVAMETAARYGSELAGLLLLDTATLMPPQPNRQPPGEMIGWRPDMEMRPNKIYPDLETAMGRFRLSPPQPCANDFLMEYMGRHSLTELEGGWTWKFDPVSAYTGFQVGGSGPRRAWTPRCRTAIIYGEKSYFFGPEALPQVKTAAGPSVPVVVIPEAYHHIMLDQPLALASALNAVISTWLVEGDRPLGLDLGASPTSRR